MPSIISKPVSGETVSGSNTAYGFGYYEIQNSRWRRSQEDTLVWHTLLQSELTPAGRSIPLKPNEIGHRLWTTYQLLDQNKLEPGTTAATIVYDGNGNLITAILADAAAFVAFYDKEGHVLNVLRLNAITHKPTNPEELKRITDAGGFVMSGRVGGSLAISRAIGDHSFKELGVISEATIDVANIQQLMRILGLDPNQIGRIQTITTCDGFTDGSGKNAQTKEDHEDYLRYSLNKRSAPGLETEEQLAEGLVLQALTDGSTDNVSVTIQTITNTASPFIMGVYDGHGGIAASTYVAENIGAVFKEQCSLTSEAYAKQELSIHKKRQAYERDNLLVETVSMVRDMEAPGELPPQNDIGKLDKEEALLFAAIEDMDQEKARRTLLSDAHPPLPPCIPIARGLPPSTPTPPSSVTGVGGENSFFKSYRQYGLYVDDSTTPEQIEAMFQSKYIP